jgi:hypothetical protein
MLTPPSWANSIPSRMAAGIESTSESMLAASHGSGRTACRHRTIPDLPELDPPFNTITWVVTTTP